MSEKAGQKDTGIMSEEIKKLISQIPIAEDFLKELEAAKAEKPVLGLDDNYDICGNPYNTEKAEDIADASGGFRGENTVSESDDWETTILEKSRDEWYASLDIIKIHMDRLFENLRIITAEIESFSSKLPKSKIETDELERQVGAISTLVRVLSNRVDIMCENGIRDMNSQLDIIRIKRNY